MLAKSSNPWYHTHGLLAVVERLLRKKERAYGRSTGNVRRVANADFGQTRVRYEGMM